MSLGVLADSQSNWRPSRFVEELWGHRIEMRFPIVKLLDFAGRRQELEASDNPFAVIILAHLDAAETSGNPCERSRRKISLVRALYLRGFPRQDILELFRLVDWLMQLPQDWEDRFREDLAEYEDEQQMPYVTSIERIGIRKGHEQGLQEGIEKGLEQGREQALQESLLRIVRKRFGSLPEETLAVIRAIQHPERLAYLQECVISAATLADFERELGNPT